MTDRLMVTAAELRGTGADITRGGGEIATQLGRLLTEVNGLMGTWQGQAAESFVALYEQLNGGWSEVQVALDGIAEMLRATADVYEETETALATQFGG